MKKQPMSKSTIEKLAVCISQIDKILHENGNKRFYSAIVNLPAEEQRAVSAYLLSQGKSVTVQKSNDYFSELVYKAD